MNKTRCTFEMKTQKKRLIKGKGQTWKNRLQNIFWDGMTWLYHKTTGHPNHLIWEMYLHDKQGKQISYYRWYGRSFVKQYMQIVATQISANTPQETVTEVDQTTTAVAVDVFNLNATGGSTSNLKGITVGTGSTAVDILDSKLGTIIAHGNGAGQLNYGATSFDAVTVSDPNCDFVITRTFTGNAVDSVTVREVGLQVNAETSTTYCLAAREIVNQAVGVGLTLTVTATLRISDQ